MPWGLPGLELFSGRMVYCTSRNDVYNNKNVYKKECMGTFLTAALDEELGVLAWNHAKEHVPAVPLFLFFFSFFSFLAWNHAKEHAPVVRSTNSHKYTFGC
jgi:hypothetical protein